jgi:hypothetical protein
MDIPPTNGTAPWWSFLAFGLSTNPILFAIFRIKNKVVNEEKKIKLSSRNII